MGICTSNGGFSIGPVLAPRVWFFSILSNGLSNLCAPVPAWSRNHADCRRSFWTSGSARSVFRSNLSDILLLIQRG